MPVEPIITQGTIQQPLSPRAYQVALKNGKLIIGHPKKSFEEDHPTLEPGTKVTLELTPYDFEKARISALFPR